VPEPYTTKPCFEDWKAACVAPVPTYQSTLNLSMLVCLLLASAVVFLFFATSCCGLAEHGGYPPLLHSTGGLRWGIPATRCEPMVLNVHMLKYVGKHLRAKDKIIPTKQELRAGSSRVV
jgi:hypothetical protein